MNNAEKSEVRSIDRREVLKLAAIGALPFASSPTWAQAAYPSRPVRLIVPLNAGGGTDTFARSFSRRHLASVAWKHQTR